MNAKYKQVYFEGIEVSIQEIAITFAIKKAAYHTESLLNNKFL